MKGLGFHLLIKAYKSFWSWFPDKRKQEVLPHSQSFGYYFEFAQFGYYFEFAQFMEAFYRPFLSIPCLSMRIIPRKVSFKLQP